MPDFELPEQIAEETAPDPELQWPPPNKTPTPTNPYYSSGTYSDDPFNVSPEGNVYGTIRFVAQWPHKYWWDGGDYRDVVTEGQADRFELLPGGSRPFGEIWRVREYQAQTNSYLWRHYFWDSQEGAWQPIKWLWTVEAYSELPIPGYNVGDAHEVIERDVLVVWTGFEWVRLRHSSLHNNEPQLHLPPGFLKWITPDARAVYVSRTEIGLEAVPGGVGQIWINGEYVQASRQCSVLSGLPVLEWDSQTNSLIAAYIEPSNEYWIYLANTKDVAFLVDALPGDSQHAATPTWDFRGKLFLSHSPDVNGYLSDVGAGQNARLVAKVQTDDTPVSEGGPYFLRELNISIISRTTSFPETYRDYSDYRMEFVDYNRLTLTLLDGAYGQIYVGGNLEYLGANYDLTLDSRLVIWDDEEPGRVSLAAGGVAANIVYFHYLAANVDPFNFNPVNPDTNRPWTSEDDGADEHYQAMLDLRLKPFLSEKSPDHGRLSEQWPGYYTRHIGQVRTDANGRFINATDLSAIRQPTLNPTFFEGLAEIQIQPISSTQFIMAASRGTSGIVLVGGTPVTTHEAEHANVHRCRNSDVMWDYDEGEIQVPLVSTGRVIADHGNSEVYLYLANNVPCWGDLRNKLFVSSMAPTEGYLSDNWPGNNARWIATIHVDYRGEFSGSFVIESIARNPLLIDDYTQSYDKLWSSAKIRNELNLLMALFSAQQLYAVQTDSGLPIVLEYLDASTIRLRSLYDLSVIAFPDMTTREITGSGISLGVIGTTGHYYVYLSADDFYLSEDAPAELLSKLETNGIDALLVGECYMTGTNSLSGNWNVCSSHNEPTRQWSFPVTTGLMSNLLTGMVLTRRGNGTVVRTGYTTAAFGFVIRHKIYYEAVFDRGAYATLITGEAYYQSPAGNDPINPFHPLCAAQGYFFVSLSNSILNPGVYYGFSLSHGLAEAGEILHNTNYDHIGWTGNYWASVSGELVVTRRAVS